ncbi:hypothetical protein HZY91_05410 [Facklamia sp. DSM 111018]|uniref:protein-tyrosine-phosphatase n=1 Tax=Facklamia lactis TaxID=2749967 RepID=A0ABS0LQ91_9LACT|nr:hypothetical protein [Facklamia lactis]MBG9980538.1 hypothetical protein [Facklamia lactis]MBG9986330.1 hypothetical protein [Facklamia lactis]
MKWFGFQKPKLKLLFVCKANLCRSPMAESITQHIIEEYGYDKLIKVSSAGVDQGFQGRRPLPVVLELLEDHDFRTKRLKSSTFKRKMGNSFDYIICMDREVKENVQSRVKDSESNQILLFNHFLNEETDVEDPVLTQAFYETFVHIHEGCYQILTKLMATLQED